MEEAWKKREEAGQSALTPSFRHRVSLAIIFLVTGEWIDSIAKARQHPVFLGALAVGVVIAFVWMMTDTERSWWITAPASLLVIGITTGLLFAGISLPHTTPTGG